MWQPGRLWYLLQVVRTRLADGDEPGYRAASADIEAALGHLETQRETFWPTTPWVQGVPGRPLETPQGTFRPTLLFLQLFYPLSPGLLMAERAVQQDGARRAALIDWTACLVREGGNDPDTLAGLAARAVAFDPASAVYREIYGAALYRAGQYRQAIQEMQRAMRLTGRGGNNWQHLFLAMAYRGLGQADRSRTHFDQAKLDKEASWTQRLIYQCLHEEAKQVRKVTQQPKQ